MKADSQCAAILRHLQAGHSLTPMEALSLYSCNRVAARMWELKRAGHQIETRMENIGGKRVASYTLYTGTLSELTGAQVYGGVDPPRYDYRDDGE